MLRKKLIAVILLLIVCVSTNAHAALVSGKVTRVVDGDTIHIEDITVRLYGIDAPEKDQPYGEESANHLFQLIGNKQVVVEVVGQDRYNRIIGKIYLDNVYINNLLVEYGCAWWYRKYAPLETDLEISEKSAQERKLGLWRFENAVPPWKWRYKNK